MFRQAISKIESILRDTIILMIRGYRTLIRPYLGHRCRFYPTCSEFTLQSLQYHGSFQGVYLSLRRILRCHPFHAGGYDPVPPIDKKRFNF